jgi:hypothetical protein
MPIPFSWILTGLVDQRRFERLSIRAIVPLVVKRAARQSEQSAHELHVIPASLSLNEL